MFLNNSIRVTEQTLQIGLGFSLFSKMQKINNTFISVFFHKEIYCFLAFPGPDARRRAARRCLDATTAWHVPKWFRMLSNRPEA